MNLYEEYRQLALEHPEDEEIQRRWEEYQLEHIAFQRIAHHLKLAEKHLATAISWSYDVWPLDEHGWDHCKGVILQWFAKNQPARPAPKRGTRAIYTKVVIPRSVSKQVFERDAYRCVHCGGYMNLTVDHVIPESKGGTLDLDNLQTLCNSCNSRKGAR